MSCETETAEILRRAGYRQTPQRLMILRALRHAKGHISANQIADEVRAQFPGVDDSTVYRNLDVLRRMRLVTSTDLGSGDVIDCELSDDSADYACEPHFQVDDRAAQLGFDATIPVELHSEGVFSSDTEMLLHSEISLGCQGPDCGVVALLLGTTFPCAMAMDSDLTSEGR